MSDLEKLEELTNTLMKVEDNLKYENSILEKIINLSSDGYWDWNLKTNYKYLSPKLAESLGYSKKELENDPDYFQRVCHPNYIKESQDRLKKLANGEIEYLEYKCVLLHKNGNKINVLCRGIIAEKDKNGNVLRIVGTHTII